MRRTLGVSLGWFSLGVCLLSLFCFSTSDRDLRTVGEQRAHLLLLLGVDGLLLLGVLLSDLLGNLLGLLDGLGRDGRGLHVSLLSDVNGNQRRKKRKDGPW